jgi:hypothetical protein
MTLLKVSALLVETLAVALLAACLARWRWDTALAALRSLTLATRVIVLSATLLGTAAAVFVGWWLSLIDS